MTALPKRKPARRTTMTEPEPRPTPSWAELTAPLEHYQVPVILTDAERVKDDAYRDELRDQADEDAAMVNAWYAESWQATFGPLRDWLRQNATAPPDMMP